MIKINRGPEPLKLTTLRNQKLVALRGLGRVPTSNDIDGYAIVKEDLWKAQHCKCCYCEHKIPLHFQDVEHYRPKGAANRQPGSSLIHGYWWLAYTWENLLYACNACNRSYKNARFPLAAGSTALMSETVPPGSEIPLLIDPGSTTNPVEHIEFVYKADPVGAPKHWWARPRNGSLFGNETIKDCGLNRLEARELREHHYLDVVIPHAQAINLAVKSKNIPTLKNEFKRALALLNKRSIYVGFTYDALMHEAPDAEIKILLGRGWPIPSDVAI